MSASRVELHIGDSDLSKLAQPRKFLNGGLQITPQRIKVVVHHEMAQPAESSELKLLVVDGLFFFGCAPTKKNLLYR